MYISRNDGGFAVMCLFGSALYLKAEWRIQLWSIGKHLPVVGCIYHILAVKLHTTNGNLLLTSHSPYDMEILERLVLSEYSNILPHKNKLLDVFLVNIPNQMLKTYAKIERSFTKSSSFNGKPCSGLPQDRARPRRGRRARVRRRCIHLAGRRGPLGGRSSPRRGA